LEKGEPLWYIKGWQGQLSIITTERYWLVAKPRLVNSISPFNAFWKKGNIKSKKNKRPINFKKRTLKHCLSRTPFFGKGI
jgi:hypothetical protein